MEKFMIQENHIGTMRWDFADSDVSLSNRWFSYKDTTGEEVSEIQSKVNDIIFNKFNTLSSIVGECKGNSIKDEKMLKPLETDNFVYGIKLIPVKGEYNGYVFVFRKDIDNGSKKMD